MNIGLYLEAKGTRMIMAITGPKTMTVFMRHDTVNEDDLKRAVE